MGSKTSCIDQEQQQSTLVKGDKKWKRSWSFRRHKKTKESAEKETSTSEAVAASNSKLPAEVFQINNENNTVFEKRVFLVSEIPVKRNEMMMDNSLNQSYDLVFDESKTKKPECLKTPLRGPKSTETIDRELKEATVRREGHLSAIKRKALNDLQNVDKVLKCQHELKTKFAEDRKSNLEKKIQNSQILREKVLMEVTERARSFNNAVENFSPKSASKTLNSSFESAQIARKELLDVRKQKLSKHWEHVMQVKNSVKANGNAEACEGKEN